MDVTMLFLGIVLLAISAFYLLGQKRSKRARMVKMVNSFPGPFAFPILGTALRLLFIPRNDLFKQFDSRTREFWPIFRTWAGNYAEIHLSLAEHVEVILSSSAHIEKSKFYNFLHPWLGQGLLTSTGNKWHSHRKLITPTFHFKILESFMDVFVEKSEILVKILEKETSGMSFDIYPYITRCALDIICETAMGTQVNAQEESSSEYITAICEISELTLQRLLKPWLHPDFIFRWTKMGKRYEKDLKLLHGFTTKVINERKISLLNNYSQNETKENEEDALLGKKKKQAFLDLLLEASDNGRQLNDQEIREEVDTFMFEGHDTTTAGISWSLFLLGTHLDVQEQVYEELDGIFQGSDRPATSKDLQEMKCLERVIKETLRLYPSVPFIGRYANEDIQVGDHILPAGSMLSLHIYHVHRNEKHFPNPEQFNPDNFLPERVQGRHPYAYIPFSAGPRNCIGQKFAMMEEKTVLSYILRYYKVKAVEKRENINLIGELILRPEKGIPVTIEPRRKSK